MTRTTLIQELEMHASNLEYYARLLREDDDEVLEVAGWLKGTGDRLIELSTKVEDALVEPEEDPNGP